MKPGYEPKTLLGEMGQICEEAGEVLKHFGKILRFGIDNIWVDKNQIDARIETNREAFYRELDDLEACIKRIKARHVRAPEEPLGPITDDQRDAHLKLAQAAQEYLEVLADAEVAMKAERREVPGVWRRGRLREAHAKLNALVGVALGTATCTCKHDFAHDKGCPFWPNVRDK